MIKVGITGQSGFIGTHLFNTLGLFPEKYIRVPFKDSYFADESRLSEFVSTCDVIVHLAALNRHNDPEYIYKTNIGLVNQLIEASEKTNSKPHILFSSSTQEDRDNLYGKSKREGRRLLTEWAEKNNSQFTGLIIPNVFGPFGNPYYNSVIATFCHQITHNEIPKIEIDGNLKLIYVGELVNEFLKYIDLKSDQKNAGDNISNIQIPHASEARVSEILEILNYYKSMYLEQGILPELKNKFELNLFNTFRTYMDIKNHYPVKLVKNTDNRGSFVETVKLNMGGQISFSTTVPGITRGNHFHTRKIERFAVIKGKAIIQLRRIGTDEIFNFELNGDEPSYVDMPIWFTHNIKNTGEEELYTIFWINEFFNSEDSDTYFETV
jgi:UDP-2-acetamido-2,6-beta-L-arabino-hexul-4-ose reductase